ncbi:molybdate ABC transporter permease subunit [Flavobacterium gawalongense]|uniref:Molybdenum transport system permease n=1 Tax=Flavobacterium gawalongense TaxID=2594432 RepID=A0A553BLU9_9FLAO|nr:molybdate ABC transporter permease subunit [Flavobacterium gawalongense]TRX09138.1 molybdate ABC transporter permease subunit [Flavobacterium gawalongense]TRX09227.1 molybdate ABC transporter permease subunit [Flavobacterium gawalongense]TRX26684.1 molybdate ABC transporter permease subunit [Flavobacterium gawalongense]
MIDLEPLWLTAKLALITTIILLTVSIPLCYWLAYSKFKFKAAVEAIVSLPLVLPPSVLGFYLLLAFSPKNTFGKFLDQYFDAHLVFTFEGLIIASVLYSLPFMVHPIQSGLKNLPISLKEAAFTLGKSKFTTLTKILLPNIKSSILTGIVLTFAHTVGEFGVVLMIGGSIPGETKVMSIAIYDEVQSMNYYTANVYAAILFSFTFLILLGVYLLNNSFSKTNPLND